MSAFLHKNIPRNTREWTSSGYFSANNNPNVDPHEPPYIMAFLILRWVIIFLINEFLKSKGYDDQVDDVIELNTVVDNQLSSEDDDVVPFKKWFIKNIEFSNFLSYGQNQKIDFEKCDGISVVESNPPNFGGKTVLTVDLLLFLFFNETTKSSKAEEVFNRFTDKNKVMVKGEILIDGEEYIIVRSIERKLSKKNQWTIKTKNGRCSFNWI